LVAVCGVKWDLNDDICGITVWSKCSFTYDVSSQASEQRTKGAERSQKQAIAYAQKEKTNKKKREKKNKAEKARKELDQKAAEKDKKAEKKTKKKAKAEGAKKESASKEQSNKKAASRERSRKANQVKKRCVVTAYEHSNYRGRVEQLNSACSARPINIRYRRYKLGGRRRGFTASSFFLSPGCKKVQLWDEDACRYNYRDNVNIYRSAKSVKWDLNDDICGITIWSKCSGRQGGSYAPPTRSWTRRRRWRL